MDEEESLLRESAGFVEDVRGRHAFKLLRDNAESRLVIYCRQRFMTYY